MVSTARLLGVGLAIFASVAFVTASESEPDLNTKGGTANDTEDFVITDLLMMAEKEFDFDDERPIAERGVCFISEKCILFGGFCVKSRALCDGMVDSRGCRGRRCKCCIPVPACPTTTDIPTTTAIDTTQVPEGFEVFNGRVIRRTISSDTKSDYDGCMFFCDQFGAKPFIPVTEADYLIYKEVRTALGPWNDGSMWLPANDRAEEGTLRWYNGEVATNISLWDWFEGQDLFLNTEDYDCLFYGNFNGTFSNAHDVHLQICNSMISYPPICEMI